MKISGPLAGMAVLLASLAYSPAQVTVEVTQEQQQFLPGEALKAAVRITNRSGQELHLGDEEGWLTFSMESREGIVVPKLGEVPVLGSFVLGSSKVATKRVDLAPYFGVMQPGSYQIVASLRVKNWNREVTSEPKSFDVIQGARLWEQEVGVPKSSGASNGEPEMRRYILQQANYLKGQIRLYLRITDGYGKPVRVFALGPMVSFGRPMHQVDKDSNLHVLNQDGASSFNYTVCNLDGEVLTRMTFDYVDSRPRLNLDNDGNIVVTGGVRRITATDIPAPKTETSEPSSPGQGAASTPATGELSATKSTP